MEQRPASGSSLLFTYLRFSLSIKPRKSAFLSLDGIALLLSFFLPRGRDEVSTGLLQKPFLHLLKPDLARLPRSVAATDKGL